MKLKQFIFALVAMLSSFAFTANAQNVAKVGNTEYATIDDAIAAWANNTTLTLLDDVTLSDVVTLKSTEHHILNLGTYTMTAASGKNAIVIKACGNGSAERTAITINADATNPGGINAGSKCVVYYKYADGGISTEDRPIIKINGGVFTGSTSTWGTAGIYTIGTEARKCATLNISGGTFNCSINGATKSKLIISGGVFNYSVGSTGDSTALRKITGGKFKSFGFMTNDNKSGKYNKFTIGTDMEKYDVGVYVDKDGYLCIGGPVITELSAQYPAKASNYSKWSSHLMQSSAAEYGLSYEDVDMAIAKHGEANVTVYEHAGVVEELDNNAAVNGFTPTLPSEVVTFEVEAIDIEATAEATTKVTFNVEPKDASGAKVSNPSAAITFRLPVPAAWSGKANVYHEDTLLGAYTINEESGAKYVEVSSASFSEFSVEAVPPVAKIGDVEYATLADAITAAQAGDEIVIIADIELAETTEFPAGKTITLNLNNKKVSAADKNVVKNSGAALTIKNGTIERTGTVAGYAVNVVSGTLEVEDVTIVGGLYTSGTSLVATNTNISQASESRHAIYAYNCAVTINSGTYHNDNAGNAAVFAYGSSVITIEDGTFSIDNGKQTFGWTSCLLDANAGGKYVINGGEFKGHFRVQANSSMEINGGTFENTNNEAYNIIGTAVVKGGTFTDDAAKNFATSNLAGGYEVDENGTVAKASVAEVNGTKYTSLAEAVAAAQAGSEIKLLANIDGDITVPANVTLNGNDFAISGGITAAGEITFAGVTEAASFNVENTNTVVNIPAGASLQLTGTGRMVIGHGCTFNITGTIADNAAKTTDKATLTPSLVMPGASFTGAGVTFNVTNAYISAPSSYCSSSKSASETFDFNITNSIWDNAGKLAFESQSTAATVNFDLVNSVLNTGSHLVFGVSRGEVVIDNSNVNVGTSRQIENQSTMTIKNGSVVNGAVATSSNAKNPGTIIVENATYAVTGEFSGSDLGTGTLVIKNGATVSVGSITAGANVKVDAEGMTAGDEINFTANLSQFTGTLEVINNDKLEASFVDGKIVLATKPAAKIGEQGYATLEAAYEAAVNGDVIVLNESVTTFPVINKAVTFKGGKENAAVEINYALSQNFTAIDGIVRFENLTFNKPLFTEHGGNKPGLSIEFEGCNFNVNSEAGYGILIGTSWSNSVVKGLKVNNCNFKYVGTEFKGGYMLYVQCVNEVTITNNTIDGNNLYRGAIHLGDATEHATVATVSNNTIKNFCRGVMMGNRVVGSSATISGNTFDNINYSDKDSKPAQECAPIFIHSIATAEALQIALTNNKVENCANPMIYSEDTDLIKYYVTEFTGNTVAGAAVEFANSYNAPNQIFPVAKIGDVEYTSLEDAFAAATEGQTITLLDDATPALTSQRAITKAAVIDLGGNTLTLTEDDLYFGTTTFKNGTIVVDPSVKPSTAVFWMFANQTLTFDNVKIVATGVTGTYLIGLDGNNSDLNLLNGSEILVENTTALDLDIICVNASTGNDIKVENSKVNVTNLDGRVFFRGNYTVAGSSEINLEGITKAGFRIEAGQTLTIKDNAVVNIVGEPRDGGIHMTDLSATYTKAESATVNATVNEPKVAKVGENTYRTLAEAVAAVEDGGTITLIANETFTENNRYNNGGDWWDGLGYSGDKSFTIDLGGFTVSQDGALNDYLIWLKNDGAKANTITLKNGTLDAGTSAYCALATASSNAQKITINLENIKLINKNSNGATLKIRGGAELNAKAGTVITGEDSYVGIEAAGSKTVVNIYEGAEIYQNGTSSYNGCLVGVSGNATINVYGGEGQSKSGCFIAMTSGGTINIEGGEWTANTDGTYANSNKSVLVAQSANGAKSIVNVTGGTFKGGYNCYGAAVGDAQINISGGNFNANPATYLAQNYIAVENNGVWNVELAAAKIGEKAYATLEEAFKAATSGCTIDILSDVTVDYNWDARYTGGKFTVPVTINGNDKTIKFTASVNDNNYQAPFRFEADATVNNLIVDMSEVTDIRFRAISSKGNLTVDGCKFIGKDETLNCRAIIFGEGAGANVGNLAIAITNSEFINWKRGITDNENGKDVKTVTITGNTLTDAGVVVSAKETVTFTGNTVAGAYVNIKSYTAGNKLAVTATGNTLEANTDVAYNVIDAGGVVNAEGFNVVAKGNDFTGYTGGDAIWGEVWGNAKESFVIKVLDANGNVMGTTSLNNIGGIIDGDVNVTWNIKLDAASNTDEYWTMVWTTAPTIDNMPAKVELWVDGVKVSGGNVVLNGPDEIAKIYAAVTDASGKIIGYHTDIQEAIKAAAAVTSVTRTATAGTVEVLSDVTVDKWVMFAEKMNVSDGSLITLNINGVTIDGNGKTLTVKSIESAGNGGYLFYDAQNLTVKDLTINIADGLVGGIGLQSGTISNVTFNGGQYAVLPGKNGVTIDGCTFNDTKGYAIYYEDARPGIVVNGNTFNTAEGKYAITMRSDEQFTNNTITKGRVNLANSAASTVSGNDFGEERFKVYNGATATITDNTINNLVFNETNAPAASTFAADNTLSAEAQAAIDALPVMAGDGTEANPYTIGNLTQLKAFRDDVNAGNNYQGKFVKLTADIDLNNEEWTPIAYNGKTFKGSFDGGNKTIKNLKITKTLTNSAENNGIGLFGRTDDPATIKNFTIENVDITGSLYVGAAVGYGYTGKLVENVTVKGNIAIDAWWYAGVIGGNGYMNTINNCHVIGNDGSYIKGNDGSYIGGIWGFRGEGANKITNCTVTNLDIQGVDRVGGISGIGHYGNSIEGCAVNNVNVTATDPDATTVGIITGACQGTEGEPTKFEDNTVQTVTVKIGDEVVDNPGLYGTNINGGNAVTNYVAKIGNVYYTTLAEAVAAAQPGNEVVILKAGTYNVPTGKNLTITAAVEGVEFANIGAHNMGGASMTFNNVTFTYATNSQYKGLQHSGNLVYNNCTFNGQVFLYGESETFNKCTFNTTDSNNYNVWTYGAKEVAFNECIFNSAGKSVLVYTESATTTNDVAFTKCELNASAPVDGKAAIEIDTSLSAGATITVDGATTATNFAAGNVSGNSLWNNKKGNNDVANNDITVVVGDETVLAPAPIVVYYQDGTNEVFYDMLKAVPYTTNYPKLEGATIKLLADVAASGLRFMENDMVFDLNGHTYTITAGTGSQGTNTSGFQIRPEVTTDVTFKNGTIKVAEGAPVVYMFNNYATNFILEDVTVDCTNMAWSYGNSCYVVVSRGNATTTGARNVEFKGNTTIENFNSSVAGTAYSIDGTMTVGENVECGGSFKLAAGATLTAKEGLDVETVDGYILAYNNGVYATISTTANVATYAELKAAIANADIKTIVLTADINCGTEQLAITKEITLDLGGKTLTTGNAYGGMSIKGNPTIKNGTIVHASNTAAIKVWNATAFEDLVIDVQGKGDANKTIGGIVLQSGSTTKVGSIKNVTIKGAALTNGIETYNCGDAAENVIGSMENVTIDAQGTGLLISAPCGTATNCNIYGGVTGIELWIKGNYSATLALVDSDVKGGEKPVYVHDEFSTNPNIQNNGTLALTANEATTFTSESGALAAVNIARAENADRTVVDKLIENAIVCVGDVYFDDFAKAWAAVKDGQTVTLLADIEANEVILIDKSLTINGNDHKVTSSATRVFRVTTANTEVTLNDVNMVSTAVRVGENDVRGISIDIVENVKLTLNNSSVDFTDASANDWAYAVNVTGGNNHVVTVNGGTYEGANVINVRGANNNVTVKDAVITSTYPNNDQYYGACIWVLQNQGSSVEATGNTFNGSNTIAFNIGTGTALTESNNTDNTTMCVAKIGAEYYTSLADAFAAGGEVTVLHDIVLAETAIVPAGKVVTLNLNGKTISQEKACTASYEMIYNKGDLTITGNGKLSFTDTSAGDPTFGWGSYTVRNEGNLVVENGTIEHLGAQTFAKHCIMAIFQYSGSTTINGGTISTPNYRSARLWKGEMTINGGTFDGQVWVQAVDNTAKLTVNGGTFEPNGNDASAVFVTNSDYDVQFAVTDGTFNGKVGCSDATKLAGAITGGKFTETAKNGTNAALLATGLAFGEANADGYYAVEDDPATHYIATLDELKAFRDAVNTGANYYAGVTVYLAADIDMTGENWVGIGSATADHGFMGNFDGKNFKIKNLTIDNPALDSEGYAYAGLFAVTEGTDKDNQNSIKNLTIENVTINTTGHIVSAAIAYPYYTIVDNVKVCGDIKINGGNYTAGVLAYTRRCVNASNLSVVGNTGSYVKGNTTVGGVISDIQMNGGLTAVYNNFSAEGITVEGTQSVGAISGIISGQNLDKATVKNVELNSQDGLAGIVAGRLGAASTVTNVSYENVTGAATLIGGGYDSAKAVQAKIGDTYYATLAEAINAAGAGATVELLADVTLAGGYTDATEGLRIEKEITLNGNNHTIDCGTFQKGIRVYNPGKVSDFNVNFNNVTVVNNVANGRCIDTRSGNINLKVNSSTLIATNGNSQPLTIGGNDPVHRVTLNGTTIDAGNSGYAVISFVSTNVDINGANNSTISGFAAFYLKGDAKTTYLNLGQGVYTGINNHAIESGVFGTVVLEGDNNVVNLMGTNATVKAVANNTAPQAAFLVRGANNTIKVTKESAKIITEGNAYEAIVDADNAATTKFIDNGVERKLVAEANGRQFYSFEEAVRFAGNEGTIKIVNDFELADTWTIPADKKYTLDLNGKTITGTPAEAKAYAVITNRGTLTIEGDGSVICNHTLAGSTSYAVNTITNSGTLTINGGEIVNNSTAQYQIGYAIDNNSTTANAEVTVNGGKVIASGSLYYDGIRLFCNSATAENDVYVAGGEVSTIWMQNPSDGSTNKNTKDVNGYVGISGGTVGVLSLEPSAKFGAAVTGGHVGDVSYFQEAEGRDLKEFVTGGTFGTEISENFLAWGYQLTGDAAPYTVQETGRREVVTIEDGNVTEFANEKDITVGTLTYKRNFGTAKNQSFYVPFEVPMSKISDNFNVYYISNMHAYDKDEDAVADSLVLEAFKVPGNAVLKANYPYIIRAKNAGTLMNIELNEATLYSSEENSVECSSVFMKFEIQGIYSRRVGPEYEGTYLLSGGTWKQMGPETFLEPFRLGMTITESNDSPYKIPADALRSIGIRIAGEQLEDGTTVIYHVEAENNSEDVIFDLSGRRVLKAEKGGIYIINGKKVLVK